MELFTSLPPRKDGTVNVVVADGTGYKFTGQPLRCEVEDEDHADELQAKGFQTQGDFEAEQDFLKRTAEREAKRIALGLPSSSSGTFTPGLGSGGGGGGHEDDIETGGDGLPQEGNTPATGRVRRARK